MTGGSLGRVRRSIRRVKNCAGLESRRDLIHICAQERWTRGEAGRQNQRESVAEWQLVKVWGRDRWTSRSEVGGDLALGIDDVVAVLGAVETGVMSEWLMLVHALDVALMGNDWPPPRVELVETASRACVLSDLWVEACERARIPHGRGAACRVAGFYEMPWGGRTGTGAPGTRIPQQDGFASRELSQGDRQELHQARSLTAGKRREKPASPANPIPSDFNKQNPSKRNHPNPSPLKKTHTRQTSFSESRANGRQKIAMRARGSARPIGDSERRPTGQDPWHRSRARLPK